MFPFLLIFLLGLISLQGQLNSTWSTELLADNAAFSLDLQVLYDLYTSSHGEYWIWHDDLGQVWNFSDPNADPCAWQGISCLANTISISEIRLYDFNLMAKIHLAL
jgi:hypothetical protein